MTRDLATGEANTGPILPPDEHLMRFGHGTSSNRHPLARSSSQTPGLGPRRRSPFWCVGTRRGRSFGTGGGHRQPPLSPIEPVSPRRPARPSAPDRRRRPTLRPEPRACCTAPSPAYSGEGNSSVLGSEHRGRSGRAAVRQLRTLGRYDELTSGWLSTSARSYRGGNLDLWRWLTPASAPLCTRRT